MAGGPSPPHSPHSPPSSAAPISIRSLTELVIALNLWAFSFNASRLALEGFGPLTLSALRFAAACVIGLPFALWIPQTRTRLTWTEHRSLCFTALPAGIIIGLAVGLQLVGLKSSSVAATSFITALYVVFVPCMEWMLSRTIPKKFTWVSLIIAMIGTGLISQAWQPGINWYDGFTLIASLLSGVHILIISNIARRVPSALGFNLYQSFWAALVTLPFIFWLEGFQFNPTPTSWAWLLSLVVGVNLIAFSIQVRVQRIFSSTTISLIYLVESPLASVMAFFWIGERLAPLQWAGAALILAAAFVAILDGVYFRPKSLAH